MHADRQTDIHLPSFLLINVIVQSYCIFLFSLYMFESPIEFIIICMRFQNKKTPTFPIVSIAHHIAIQTTTYTFPKITTAHTFPIVSIDFADHRKNRRCLAKKLNHFIFLVLHTAEDLIFEWEVEENIVTVQFFYLL